MSGVRISGLTEREYDLFKLILTFKFESNKEFHSKLDLGEWRLNMKDHEVEYCLTLTRLIMETEYDWS